MPELPEVETLRRQLEETVIGIPLLEIHHLDAKLINVADRVGRRINGVNRHGKNLLLCYDDGRVLVVHLRMTGRLLWQNNIVDLPQYTRMVMVFRQGRIFFIDPRRFMTLAWNRTFPDNCGPDPLPGIDLADLSARGELRKGTIKSFLLDQSIIAGIGNIYACEILHLAGIAPTRPTCSLGAPEWLRLTTAADAVLNKAIACHGTSISDWRDFYGEKGFYQHELQVYRRAGLPCFRCSRIITRISLAGRGTYFCPECQT